MRSYNFNPKAFLAFVFILLLFSIPKFSLSQPGDTAKKAQRTDNRDPNGWKRSWDVFIRELIAETGGAPDEKKDKAKARFANMTVTWEGTVEEAFSADGSANGIKMQENANTPGLKVKMGNYTGDGVVVLHLKPAASQLQEWLKLMPGAKVRFKARIDESVYLILGPTVNIMVNSAEILK